MDERVGEIILKKEYLGEALFKVVNPKQEEKVLLELFNLLRHLLKQEQAIQGEKILYNSITN